MSPKQDPYPLWRATLAIGWVASLISAASVRGDVIRVKPGADPTNSFAGDSWANATNLQRALAAAESGDQIWVNSGVYYPDEGQGQADGDRSATFAFAEPVELFGGFAGTELGLGERNLEAAVPSVLSGDINQDDVNTDGNNIAESTDHIVGDNSYHVLNASGLTSPGTIDGFTITAGYGERLAVFGADTGSWRALPVGCGDPSGFSHCRESRRQRGRRYCSSRRRWIDSIM